MPRFKMPHFTTVTSAYPFGSRAECSCGWRSWRTFPWPDLAEVAALRHEQKKSGIPGGTP